MKPKKSLGQHWLYDEASLLAVCDAGLVHEHDVVLEVGPGLGTLTKLLVEKAGRVIAVEYDEELAKNLPRTIDSAHLDVIYQDILKFNFSSLPKNYKVVANIPYYLTSSLIRVLSEAENPPKVIALLVQKEVAERVAAKPGKMSILGVSAQMYFEAHLDKLVSAELFTPPPKVDSQIVQLLRRPKPYYGNRDSKKLFKIIKAGFSSKRKTLVNSLSGGLGISKPEVENVLLDAGINPMVRAQELSIDSWLKIYDRLQDL